MSRIGRNLSIVLRAERAMARHRMTVLRTQTLMMVGAGIVAGLGLIMLNLAAFLALREQMSPAAAALIVALVNLGLAAVLILTASRTSASPEMDAMAELRDMALEDLETEADDVVAEIRVLGDSVKSIAKDPMGSLLPRAIVPLILGLLKSVKK